MAKHIQTKEDEINEIKNITRVRNNELALEKINEYLYENPNDLYIYVYKAMILGRLKRKDEAREIITHALSLPIEERVRDFAYEELAIMAIEEGNYEDAIRYYEYIIRTTSNLALKVRRSLSRLYAAQKRFDDAFEVLKIENFNHDYLNTSRAYIYYLQGLYDEALKSLEEPIIANKYLFYDKSLDHPDGVRNNEARTTYIKGCIARKRGNIEEALKYFKEVVKNTNDKKKVYWEAKLQIATINFLHGYDDITIRICKDIIQNCTLEGKRTNAYDVYGRLLIRRLEFDEAYKIYNDCNNEEIKKMGFAQLKISNYEFEEALKLLSEIDVSEPEMKYYNLYSLLQVLYRLDKYDEYVKYYNEFKQLYDMDYVTISFADIERMKLYLDKKNNKEFTVDTQYYSNVQIVNYSDELAIKHIIERHSTGQGDGSFKNGCDIRKLFYEIKNSLSNYKPICDGLHDKYVIEMPDIGYGVDGSRADYVVVFTLPNSTDIITMYATSNFDKKFEVKFEKAKQKRLSPKEKFEMKYGSGY